MKVKKIPIRYLTILKLIDSNPGLTTQDMIDLDPTLNRQVFSKCLSDQFIVSNKERGTKAVTYTITKFGREILTNQDAYTFINYTPHKTGKPSKKLTVPGSDKPNVVPIQADLNISQSADTLLDTVSKVVKENAEYRALILKVVNEVAESLNLKLVTLDEYKTIKGMNNE